MIKEFTDKDKMLARKYIAAGYKWIARDIDGDLFIYFIRPMKMGVCYNSIPMTVRPLKRVDKRNFKPVQFSDSEPTRLDDIIGEEE